MTPSPAATELEELTLDWLRQMLGLPDGLDAVIMDTASVASLVAIAAATGRPAGVAHGQALAPDGHRIAPGPGANALGCPTSAVGQQVADTLPAATMGWLAVPWRHSTHFSA